MHAGLSRSPGEAIVASLHGPALIVAKKGDLLRSHHPVRFALLGDPLLGESGAMAWMATLSGPTISPATSQALIYWQDGQTTVAAQTGAPAPHAGSGVTFLRFQSVVLTDTAPARLLFTATLAGPGGWTQSQSLWCFTPATGLTLLLRDRQPVAAGGETLRVRTFTALTAATPGSPGQGRSTDEAGFATVRATLSGGHCAALRLVLP